MQSQSPLGHMASVVWFFASQPNLYFAYCNLAEIVWNRSRRVPCKLQRTINLLHLASIYPALQPAMLILLMTFKNKLTWPMDTTGNAFKALFAQLLLMCARKLGSSRTTTAGRRRGVEVCRNFKGPARITNVHWLAGS